jgi:hypothetical protein
MWDSDGEDCWLLWGTANQVGDGLELHFESREPFVIPLNSAELLSRIHRIEDDDLRADVLKNCDFLMHFTVAPIPEGTDPGRLRPTGLTLPLSRDQQTAKPADE